MIKSEPNSFLSANFHGYSASTLINGLIRTRDERGYLAGTGMADGLAVVKPYIEDGRRDGSSCV